MAVHRLIRDVPNNPQDIQINDSKRQRGNREGGHVLQLQQAPPPVTLEDKAHCLDAMCQKRTYLTGWRPG